MHASMSDICAIQPTRSTEFHIHFGCDCQLYSQSMTPKDFTKFCTYGIMEMLTWEPQWMTVYLHIFGLHADDVIPAHYCHDLLLNPDGVLCMVLVLDFSERTISHCYCKYNNLICCQLLLINSWCIRCHLGRVWIKLNEQCRSHGIKYWPTGVQCPFSKESVAY